ncbi:MAG: 3D domain-containing protein [Phycisphaeraceae bacterium]|nr:3D domain-containing protein [Phycisphaeraceae bacterium]
MIPVFVAVICFSVGGYLLAGIIRGTTSNAYPASELRIVPLHRVTASPDVEPRVTRSDQSLGPILNGNTDEHGLDLITSGQDHGMDMAGGDEFSEPGWLGIRASMAREGADAVGATLEIGYPGLPDGSTPRSDPKPEPVHFVEPDADVQVFSYNGRLIRPRGTIVMRVTAYSPDRRSCGNWADGVTASGRRVTTNGGRLVAADTRILPFGAIVSIPGYHNGQPVPVLDRGGAIKGLRLDVLYPTHQRARQWGVQDLEVTVWEYAD